MATIINAKKDAILFTAENFNRICPEGHVLIRQKEGLFLLVANPRKPDEWRWVKCLDETQRDMIVQSGRPVAAPRQSRRDQSKQRGV